MDNSENKNIILNQDKPNTPILSHDFKRAFKPHKLTPPRDTHPVDIANLACGVALVLEIGAGKGKHAIQYAQANPRQSVVAIERTKNKFNAFSKSIEQVKTDNTSQRDYLSNLYPMHADAIPFITHNIRPNSVDTVFILYPNPEPHNPNQQWLNMPFFEFLLSRLTAGGRIIITSNIESYIDNAQTQAQQVWHIACKRHKIASDSARTHFEIKYLARGEPCWELQLTKPNNYHTRFDQWYV